VFTTAGSGFAATVGAYLWQGADDAGNDGVPDTNADVTNNGLTPAYDWATTVTAVLDQPAVVQGGAPGAFQNGSIAGGFSGGSVTIGDFRYFEVGSIRLHAEA